MGPALFLRDHPCQQRRHDNNEEEEEERLEQHRLRPVLSSLSHVPGLDASIDACSGVFNLPRKQLSNGDGHRGSVLVFKLSGHRSAFLRTHGDFHLPGEKIWMVQFDDVLPRGEL